MLKTSSVKSANIMLRGEKAYLNSISSTNFLSIDTPPFIVTEWTSQTAEEKLILLRQAIEGSRKDLQFPKNPSEFSKSILRFFGFKSFSQMYKNAINCLIDFDEDRQVFLFIPAITDENGSEGLKHEVEEVSMHESAEKIIAILERSLAKSRF